MARTKFPESKNTEFSVKIHKAIIKGNSLHLELEIPSVQNTGIFSLSSGSVGGPTNLRECNLINNNIKNFKLKRSLLDPKCQNSSKKSVPNKRAKRNEEYLPLSRLLFQIIRTNKNIKYNRVQIKQWANEIRILVNQNKIDYKRVEDVLMWYKDNIGGEYIPVVESGYSLRMKFLRLEEASKRASKEAIGKKPVLTEYGELWFLNKKDGKYYNKAGQLLM